MNGLLIWGRTGLLLTGFYPFLKKKSFVKRRAATATFDKEKIFNIKVCKGPTKFGCQLAVFQEKK